MQQNQTCYSEFLESIEMTEEEVSAHMDSLPDPVLPADDTIYPIFSKIQGIGLASTNSFEVGEEVAVLLDDGIRQVGARYLNHSADPNTIAQGSVKNLSAIATKPIKAGEEITISYTNNLKVLS